MGILQTAERSTQIDPSENVIFQRHLIAYKEAAKLISGTVLELGSGEGYALKELLANVEKYIGIDKHKTFISEELTASNKITFIQNEIPPINQVDDNSIDFVVTFQVIEHINDDEKFIEEIYRVLKPNGKLILTTPNILMSLSRNPWHIREYNPKQMKEILQSSFSDIEVKGIFGNDKVMRYYEENKKSVNKITRFDIFNMQYWLPRWTLQVPYDILNRLNRRNLQDENKKIVDSIKYTDYYMQSSTDNCLDFFCIATK
tara:strand:+ start:499 stop:1275 length:777 start_codon:yes stop_codon:yes gene_type:complete